MSEDSEELGPYNVSYIMRHKIDVSNPLPRSIFLLGYNQEDVMKNFNENELPRLRVSQGDTHTISEAKKAEKITFQGYTLFLEPILDSSSEVHVDEVTKNSDLEKIIS